MRNALAFATAAAARADISEATGKVRGKESLGRPRRSWVNNIKMDLAEIGLGCVDWIASATVRNKWKALVNKYSAPQS
jgi:hypothetical protein